MPSNFPWSLNTCLSKKAFTLSQLYRRVFSTHRNFDSYFPRGRTSAFFDSFSESFSRMAVGSDGHLLSLLYPWNHDYGGADIEDNIML